MIQVKKTIKLFSVTCIAIFYSCISIASSEIMFLSSCKKVNGLIGNGSCICPSSRQKINPFVESCSDSTLIQTFTANTQITNNKYSEFCNSTSGLEDLYAKAACSISSNIQACKGLVAGVTGVAVGTGAAYSSQEVLKKIFIERLKTNKKEIVLDLAKTLHERWKGSAINIDDLIKKHQDAWSKYINSNLGYSGGLSEHGLQHKEMVQYLQNLKKNGATVAYEGLTDEIKYTMQIHKNIENLKYANTSFEQLPEQVKNQYIKAMENLTADVVENYQKPLVSLSAKEISNSTAVTKLMNPKTDGQVIKFFGIIAYSKDRLTSVDTKLADYFRELSHFKDQNGYHSQQFVEQISKTFIGEDIQGIFLGTGKFANLSSQFGLLNSAGTLTKKVIPKLVGAATGTVAGAVMLYATTTSSEFCEERNHQYINVDNKCEQKYLINKSVVDFLEFPKDKQLELMKDKKVCEYYKSLHMSEFSIPYGVKISKKSNNTCEAIFPGANNNNLTVNINVDKYSGNGDITLINKKLPAVLPVKNNYIVNFDKILSGSKNNDLSNQYLSNILYKIQPILPEIMSCCSEKTCDKLTPNEPLEQKESIISLDQQFKVDR